MEEPLKAREGACAILDHPFKEKKTKTEKRQKGQEGEEGEPEMNKKKDNEAEKQKPARKRRKKAPSSTTGSDSGLATSPVHEPSPEYNEVLLTIA